MSLNLSGLAAYTDQHSQELVSKSILAGRTLSQITVIPGVKHSIALNILDGSVTMQAGGCGWNPSGSTTLTQKTLTVSPLSVQEAICVPTLELYWTSELMKAGSLQEEIPFEEKFSEIKALNIARQNEELIWKGNTSTGSGNMALINGFLQQFTADAFANVINGNPTAINVTTGITSSNIMGIIDGMVALTPTEILDQEDLTIFISHANFHLYAKALRDLNLFHFTSDWNLNGKNEIVHPGTNVKVSATTGLVGSDDMVLASAKNLVAGVDLMSEEDAFRIWYSQDYNEVRVRADLKLGVATRFPSQVVYFTLHA